MKKTAKQIADSVLEKTGRSRGAKELIKMVTKKHPTFDPRGLSAEEIRNAFYRGPLESPIPVAKRPVMPTGLIGGQEVPKRPVRKRGGAAIGNRKGKRLGRGNEPKRAIPKKLPLGFSALTKSLRMAKKHGRDVRERGGLTFDLRDLRTFNSHLHGPRKGEVLIPSTGTPMLNALDASKLRKRLVFRGNPRPGRGQGAYWGSRHPDVGGNFAVADRAVAMTQPTNKIYAYDAPKKHQVVETPADVATPLLRRGDLPASVRKQIREGDVEPHFMSENMLENKQMRQEHRLWELKNRRAVRRRGHTNRTALSESPEEFFQMQKFLDSPHFAWQSPSFEVVFPNHVRPRIRGVYEGRRSRTPEGLPAIAVSKIRGMSPQKAFSDVIGQRSPLYSDLR